MLNFYPWGLSINRVCPEAIDRTRVEFRSYVSDESKLRTAVPAARCTRSSWRTKRSSRPCSAACARASIARGRYSPTRERGTHHFHRLLCEFMSLNE